jgi:hypothetical protein
VTGASLGVGERLRRAFVPLIDRTAPLRGPLATAGGVLALGSFADAEVEYYLRKLGQGKRYRLGRGEIRELLHKLAPYQVAQLLRAYLGPLWSADYAAIWRSAQQSSSGEWHHDNVGNRVKLFVILANDSERNGTEFIVHTNRTRWDSFSGRLPAPEREASFLRQQRGDMLMFDTNAIHRGRYSAQERVILQLEFSSILKSFVVSGHCGRFFRARLERRYGMNE